MFLPRQAGALHGAVVWAAFLESRRPLVPRSGIQVSKKQVFPPAPRKDSVLWGASVTDK